VQVELSRLDADAVARAVRLDPISSEHLAESVDRHLKCVRRRIGGAVAPEAIDQAISRHGLVGMEQKEGEEGPLLRPAQRQGAAPLTTSSGPSSLNSRSAARPALTGVTSSAGADVHHLDVLGLNLGG